MHEQGSVLTILKKHIFRHDINVFAGSLQLKWWRFNLIHVSYNYSRVYALVLFNVERCCMATIDRVLSRIIVLY